MPLLNLPDIPMAHFYGMSPADFKAAVEKNGMYVLSSHTGIPVPDSAGWDAAMAWWDTCITAHAADWGKVHCSTIHGQYRLSVAGWFTTVL